MVAFLLAAIMGMVWGRKYCSRLHDLRNNPVRRGAVLVAAPTVLVLTAICLYAAALINDACYRCSAWIPDSRWIAAAILGVVFGVVCERWLSEIPSPGSAHSEKLTLFSQLPWVLFSGTLFFIALILAPELDLMRRMKSLKAGDVELHFETALASGQSERFRLQHVTETFHIWNRFDEFEDILAADKKLLNARQDARLITSEEYALMTSAQQYSEALIRHVLLPTVKCGRAVRRIASDEQLLQALGPLQAHIRRLLESTVSHAGKKGAPNGLLVNPDEKITKDFIRLSDLVVATSNETLRNLRAWHSGNSKDTTPSCADRVEWPRNQLKEKAVLLAWSPHLFRLTAELYRYSRQYQEIPEILSQDVLDRFPEDHRMREVLATTYYNRPHADLENAVKYSRETLSIIQANLKLFKQPGTEPGYTRKREGVAKNNLAWYLAEAEQKLPEATRLAKEAMDADPKNMAFIDTHGYVRLVRAVKDRTIPAHVRSTEIAEAIQTFEDVLKEARRDKKYEQELWTALHLKQAKEIFDALR